MQIATYLSFQGQCEEAFAFYEACLGAKRGPTFRYAGSPLSEKVSADWQDKVMHASVTIGNQELMGADAWPGTYEEPRGFSISLQMKVPAAAERVFSELSEQGKIVLPLEQTFRAARFGMVVDRFGIPWLINCEGAVAAPNP